MSNRVITILELVDALEMQSNEITYYFNKKENDLVFVMDDVYCDDEMNSKLFQDIENNFENYIALPTSYEINEYQIMEAFVDEQKKDIQNILNKILNGKRPFGRFKDKIFELDIREEWFEFKKVQLEKIALDWCEVNNIEIVGR
jgi:hypothetical protein